MYAYDKIPRPVKGLLDGVDDSRAVHRLDPGRTGQFHRPASHLERLVKPCRLDVRGLDPGVGKQAVDKVVTSLVGVRVWALR